MALIVIGLVSTQSGCRQILGIEKREEGANAQSTTGGAAGENGAAGASASGGNAGVGAAGVGGTAGSAATSGTGGSAGGCQGTGLPVAELRIGNLVPDTQTRDFCLHPVEQESTCETPISTGLGPSGSTPGFGYKQISRTLEYAAGDYRVKSVAVGAACSADGIEYPDVLTLTSGQRSTVLLMQQDALSPTFHVFNGRGAALERPVRFIHAMTGGGSLQLGFSDSDDQATMLIGTLFPMIGWGEKAPIGPSGFDDGQVDADGFTTNPFGSVTPYGITDGTTLLGAALVPASGTNGVGTGNVFEFIAVGRLSDPSFPTELMVYREPQGASPGLYLISTLNAGLPLTVESFDVQLRDKLPPYHETERRDFALDAIAASTSDIVCVQSLYSDDDRTSLIQRAAAHFPYSTFVPTGLSTPPNDPKRLDGTIPEAQGIPCMTGWATPLLDCAAAHCSTVPGSTAGEVTSFNCISAQCLPSFFALANSTLPKKTCFNCLLYTGTTRTLDDTNEYCTTQPYTNAAYEGRNGVVLLSKYPFQTPEVWNFPPELFQQSMLRVPIELPNTSDLTNGTMLDLYCGFLSEQNSSVTLPYTGQYGDGTTGGTAWAKHQELQAKQLVEWVKQKSGLRRAIIAASADLSVAYMNGTTTLVDAHGSDEGKALIYGAFSEAVAPGYTPGCTYCPSNPLITGAGNGFWISHLYGHRVGVTSVTTSELTHQEAIVPIADPSNPTQQIDVTVSNSLGIRSTFLLPR